MAVIGLTCGLTPAVAQAQEEWSFVSFEAFRYDTLIDNRKEVGPPCCVPQVVAVPGHALLHLSAVIDVPWSDELTRVSISSRDLTLTVPGVEEPLHPFGHYENRGIFEANTFSLSAYRPNDWPDADQDMLMEQVWAVPEDATTATLTFGEFWSTEIEIPQETSEPLTPADTASFEIEAMTPVDVIEVGTDNYGQDIFGTLAPNAGQIVQVDFTITPLMETTLNNSHGMWLRTRHLQLVGPNGLPTLPLGQILSASLTNDTVNSFSGDAFLNKPYDRTFYFLTDGAPGTYTLYFLSDAVAEGTL
jgi:hypothetical protein